MEKHVPFGAAHVYAHQWGICHISLSENAKFEHTYFETSYFYRAKQ